MICPTCGYQNPEDQFLCIHCGLVLRREDLHSALTNNVTNPLGPPDDIPLAARWGTSRLGAEHKLVLLIKGSGRPLEVNLQEQLVLGRVDEVTGEAPDIDLSPFGARAAGVSRRHALLLSEDDGLKVSDLGSSNATYMNGQKLIPHQRRILRDGDELRLGNLVMRVHFI